MEGVEVKLEIVLDIDEYVGQENLNSNVENAGGRETEIERRVTLYDRRPEAVDKVAEIVRVLLYALARVLTEKRPIIPQTVTSAPRKIKQAG